MAEHSGCHKATDLTLLTRNNQVWLVSKGSPLVGGRCWQYQPCRVGLDFEG